MSTWRIDPGGVHDMIVGVVSPCILLHLVFDILPLISCRADHNDSLGCWRGAGMDSEGKLETHQVRTDRRNRYSSGFSLARGGRCSRRPVLSSVRSTARAPNSSANIRIYPLLSGRHPRPRTRGLACLLPDGSQTRGHGRATRIPFLKPSTS